MTKGYAMFEIHDSYGIPQCGCEIIKCETWEDVEEYFNNDEALKRLAWGYATIVEL